MESWTDIDGFIRDDALTELTKLSAETKPLWGIMTPIHMIENLSYGFHMSIHNFQFKEIDEKIIQNKLFVMENGFPISQRQRKKANLKPTIHNTNEDALIELRGFIFEFYDVIGSMDSSFKTSHFYFGPLDFDGWRIFHFRHLQHHLQQFGLLPLSEGKMQWKWPSS